MSSDTKEKGIGHCFGRVASNNMVHIGHRFRSPRSDLHIQDSEGGGGRHCPSPLSNGSSSWRGSVAAGRGLRRLGRALERRLTRPSATRRRIGEPLPLDAQKSAVGSFQIIDSKRNPVVVHEVALGSVAMQMRLADVEIAAVNRPLEDAEITFDRVRVPEIGADVFLGTVVHRAVPGELPPDRPIDGAFVGHQVSGAIDIRGNDWPKGLGGDVRNMEAAHPPVALDQGQNRRFRRDATFPVRSLAADEGFITFNNLVLPAKRVGDINPQFGHRLANAMPEKPCGFHPTLESALKLPGADPLFRGTEQIDRLEPDPHRDVARLKNRADLDGEWLTAGIAFVESDPTSLSPQPADLLRGRAAVRADWAIRPEPRFDVTVSGFFAMKMCDRKVTLHGRSP